jgi:hypothetical protein
MSQTFWGWLRQRRRRWTVGVVAAVLLLALIVTAWELVFVFDILEP